MTQRFSVQAGRLAPQQRQAAPVPRVWPRDFEAYRSYGSPAAIKSILVLKVDHLGDFLLALDAMLALRKYFPNATMTLACGPWNVELAKALNIFDHIYGLDFFPARADSPLFPFNRAKLGYLLARRFDLAIDLRVDPDTRVLLSCINATYKCGYESELCPQLTITLPRPGPAATRNLGASHQCLQMLRLAHSAADYLRPRDDAETALRQAIAGSMTNDLGIAGGRGFVTLNTSSGRMVKNWPLDRFADLAAWLCRDKDVRVMLLGTADQLADAAVIAERCNSPNLHSMVGKTTVQEAFALIARSDLYIGNDTGLTHFAARIGVPTLAIYSGIDPVSVWAPVGRDVTVISAPVACSPCHISDQRECAHDRICVTAIDVGLVREAVEEKLQRAGRLTPATALPGG